jgi:hypothetical protein
VEMVVSILVLLVLLGLSKAIHRIEDEIRNSDIYKSTKTIPDPLDYDTYKSWPKLPPIEKLKYLFTRNEIEPYIAEYSKLLRFAAADDSRLVTYDDIMKSLSEFQDERTLRLFFQECDTSLDHFISFEEYVICRCEFDSNGHQNDLNEFDAREGGLLFEYSEFLNTPIVHGHLQYDENGIIVD